MVASRQYRCAVKIMQRNKSYGYLSSKDRKYKIDIASIFYALRNRDAVVLDVIREGLYSENIPFGKWADIKMKKLYIENILKGGHGRGDFFCQIPGPWACGKFANDQQFEELLSIVNVIIAEWAVLDSTVDFQPKNIHILKQSCVDLTMYLSSTSDSDAGDPFDR